MSDDEGGSSGGGSGEGGPTVTLEMDVRVGDPEASGSGVFERRAIAFEATYGDVTLAEFPAAAACDGAPLVDGVPSTGGHMIKVIAASFLADHLSLPIVAELSSPKFPSVCVVERSRPAAAMRIVGDGRVCAILSEFKIEDPELASATLVRRRRRRGGCSAAVAVAAVCVVWSCVACCLSCACMRILA
jgi:hypothetical protein